MNSIPINHIYYNWETNSCQISLKDRVFIDSEENDINTLVKKNADLFLKCCYKTVLYCQRKDSSWEIIIPTNYLSYTKNETFTTLDAFIFQNHNEYDNIFCQTSYYLVTEKNRYTIVKFNVDEHIENLSDVVKKRLSENYKSVFKVKSDVSTPFGKVASKKTTDVVKNKFAEVAADRRTAHTNAKTDRKSAATKASTKASTNTSAKKSEPIVWEIQENWD